MGPRKCRLVASEYTAKRNSLQAPPKRCLFVDLLSFRLHCTRSYCWMRVQMSNDALSAQCSCGAVVLALRGAPIGSIACYCDTCQEGSSRIEALPHATAVRERDGGTEYVLYRKDRVAYAKGQELVKGYKLDQSPKTNRVVATCCNSAMMMCFDDARHWIPIYRARFGANAPAIQMRICTSYLPAGEVLPNDIPSYRNYSGGFMVKLLSSRVAMLFRR